MKTLILYASRNGSTAEAARRIAARLGGCDVKDIAREPFNLTAYDRVLIGSSIRMGTMDRKIRTLFLRDIGTLLEKELGIFLCCCFSENADVYFQNNVPSQLLEHAKAAVALGGVLDRARLRGRDRLVANMVLKADHTRGVLHTFSLKDDEIEAFVEKLQAK